MKTRDTPDEENQRLESRVRENRTHGSEGGEVKAFPTPIGEGYLSCDSNISMLIILSSKRWIS